MSDEDVASSLESSLATDVLGHPLRFYPIALTTESLALGWARTEDAPEGATVVADQELSPRQRKGPPWVAFAGRGLYFSTVLRPGLPPEGEGLLWLLAALGAAEGLAAATGLDVRIKWPDDLLVGARKIGGVKMKAQLGPQEIASAVLTFRLNLDVTEAELPEDLRADATSVSLETGRAAGRAAILGAILSGLERRYDDDVPSMLEGYRARCETLGRAVRALLVPRGEVIGTARDVDSFGSLVVEAGSRRRTVPPDVLKKLEPAG